MLLYVIAYAPDEKPKPYRKSVPLGDSPDSSVRQLAVLSYRTISS
jgi:hypothetical protein